MCREGGGGMGVIELSVVGQYKLGSHDKMSGAVCVPEWLKPQSTARVLT